MDEPKADSPGDEELKELVSRHRVCFESYPIWHTPRAGGRLAVGYELDLIGSLTSDAEPGIDECAPLQRTLAEIARAIVPQDDGDSRFQLEPFDAAVHLSPRRKMREDVIVAIDITHRDQFDLPAGESQLRSLRTMVEHLKKLGARAEKW